MKTTDELVNEITRTTDILDYLERNQAEMQENTLTECLEAWLRKKTISKADVVRGSNLNRAYVYQISRGKSIPAAIR